MQCPDCRAVLVEVSVSGLDMSYRCFKCGGFWIRPKTVNQLHIEELQKWKPVDFDPGSLIIGDKLCPTDGKKLSEYTGVQIPEGLLAYRCLDCGWWWWSGDSLFRFKPVQEESVRKVGSTKKFVTLSMYLLPILSLVLMVGLITVGSDMVKQRQQTSIGADAGVIGFSATNLADGEVIVSFKTLRKDVKFEYSESGRGVWIGVKPVFINDTYTVKLSRLTRGAWYEVRIAGAVFEFQAN